MDYLKQYDLAVMHCELCNDTGHIIERTGTGIDIVVRECSCMNRRRSIRSLRKSGLEELIDSYTFDSYQTPDDTTRGIKNCALKYLQAPPAWFYIYGKPGSGKTHICTAICRRLIQSGERVYYFRWADEVSKIKVQKASSPPPPDYLEHMEFLKAVPVLYIDDFLKTKPTAADLNLAFEILNARYVQPSKRTIISSEKSIQDVSALDNATGSRIAQRAKRYTLKSPPKNWRLEAW